jgi:class 3 adenylate cyclase
MAIQKERDVSEMLLHNILPKEVANELKEKGYAEARDFEQASILFTDFKGFTSLSEQLSASELVAEVDSCFKVFDGIVEKYGVEKIKTIGDAYMAAGGLPDPGSSNAIDVVSAALEMQNFMIARKIERSQNGLAAFEMRLGIHTGPVVAGIVGVKKFQYDIWGDTVNTANRMESSGETEKVNISETTYEFVKDNFECVYRGEKEAKGKGKVKMYFVVGELMGLQ